jgi:hypothetical protein
MDRPTLTITSHPSEDIAGDPLKLDQLGITHFSCTMSNAGALLEEGWPRARRWPDRDKRSPIPRAECAASTYPPQTES